MKQLTSFILLTLILAGCGSAGNRFTVEGRILNMNQGEFYVYSLDGSIDHIDTIRVNGGRLRYEMVCKAPATLMMVFPNFSEQPIFAEPGKTVEFKADASHLKEMEVKGTKENKLMNLFRKQIAEASPPETLQYAEKFVKDHPESAVSVYLIWKYFITYSQPNYRKSSELIRLIQQAQPNNHQLVRCEQKLKGLGKVQVGKPLPQFSAKDVMGKTINNKNLSGSTMALVHVYATWNYDSHNFFRQLQSLYKRKQNKLKIISVCIDPDVQQCKKIVERDSIPWPVICDGNMLETPILQTLGLYKIPDNILIQYGKVTATGMKIQDLKHKLETTY